MKLYWFWSTNPQKVRMALEELGLPYERHEVDLTTNIQKGAEYRAINPRGKVPALVDEEAILWESNACLNYLGHKTGRLWPQDDKGLAEALSLLHFESAAFQDLAGTHFFNLVVLPRVGQKGDPERVAKAAKKLQALLDLLEQRLEGKNYLLGDFSLVDLAFAVWLPVIDLSAHGNCRAWRTRLMARPAWKACEFVYGQDLV
jgi:GST-like protein